MDNSTENKIDVNSSLQMTVIPQLDKIEGMRRPSDLEVLYANMMKKEDSFYRECRRWAGEIDRIFETVMKYKISGFYGIEITKSASGLKDNILVIHPIKGYFNSRNPDAELRCVKFTRTDFQKDGQFDYYVDYEVAGAINEEVNAYISTKQSLPQDKAKEYRKMTAALDDEPMMVNLGLKLAYIEDERWRSTNAFHSSILVTSDYLQWIIDTKINRAFEVHGMQTSGWTDCSIQPIGERKQ